MLFIQIMNIQSYLNLTPILNKIRSVYKDIAVYDTIHQDITSMNLHVDIKKY